MGVRAAVVGHVEWIEFARVERVPRPGEIVHARETREEPGGGGSVAAVQLQRLTGNCTFFTALGDSELGRRALRELAERFGMRVEATFRPTEQRRAFTFIDDEGERTITVIGDRLGPDAADPLPWDDLDGVDGVYFTAGDRGALEAARRGRVLVATPRAMPVLRGSGVLLDALVGSGTDPDERFEPGDLDPTPRLAIWTEGSKGGRYVTADGTSDRFEAAPLPGPVVDAYGTGDTFAAGLTYALAAGSSVDDALAFAARCAAIALTGRGPYGSDISAALD
ncbi:MAG TPA: PfkB family carbohydrate kinase [Actinomycetota bacterium]|nr:PfkB family carbohydrate kinase [Actinomycetota bacterium]